MAQLNLTTVIMFIHFFILIYLLKKILYQPLGEFLDKRAENIKNQLEFAASEREKALVLKETYDRKMDQISLEAEEIKAKAIKEAEELRREIHQKAEDEAREIRKKATDDIENEKEKAMVVLREQAAKISIQLARKIVEKEVDEKVHANLIDNFISGLGDLS